MDSSSRSSDHDSPPFDEDEGSKTAMFQLKMSDVFSSLDPAATATADADITSLLGESQPVPAPPPATPSSPFASAAPDVPGVVPPPPSSTRQLSAPLPTAAAPASRGSLRFFLIALLVLVAALAAGLGAWVMRAR